MRLGRQPFVRTCQWRLKMRQIVATENATGVGGEPYRSPVTSAALPRIRRGG